MPDPYHTALKDASEYPELRRVVSGGSVGLVHDVTTGMLPPEFDRCEVFYGDPPWKDGAALFDARLGLTGRKYAGLMLGLRRIIASVAPRPVVMVMGKSGLKFLSPPDEICKTRLNGAEAIAACWRIAPGKDWGSATAVLSDLASRYRVAGDFFCGYGRTAEYFAEPERSCVLSDYNPKCIGGVASRFGK